MFLVAVVFIIIAGFIIYRPQPSLLSMGVAGLLIILAIVFIYDSGSRSVNKESQACIESGGNPVTVSEFNVTCVYATPGR